MALLVVVIWGFSYRSCTVARDFAIEQDYKYNKENENER